MRKHKAENIIVQSEQPPSKKKKGKEKKETVLKETTNSVLQCLDRIAWLLQRNSKSCAAVGLVNNKLIIADNEITESTGSENEVFKFIEKIFDYFSHTASLVNEDKKAEELLNEKRNVAFKLIFDKKFFGEEKGYLIPAVVYKNIIEDKLISILNNKFDSKKSKAQKKQEKDSGRSELIKKASHSRQQIAAAYQIGLDIIHRMECIEKFLTDPNEKNNLLKIVLSEVKTQETEKGKEKEIKIQENKTIRFSQYGDPELNDFSWINDSKQKGVAVLATNMDTVHAELKIIDFLFATDFFTNQKFIEKPFYIGISKSSCLHCDKVIEIINNEFCKRLNVNRDSIQITATHSREFDKWNKVKPFFLITEREQFSKELYYFSPSQNKYTSEPSLDTICYFPRETSLEKDIREIFDNWRPNFSVIPYYGKNKHTTTLEHAEQFLLKQPYKSIVVYKNRANQTWYYAVQVHSSQEIKHIELTQEKTEEPFTKKDKLKKEVKDFILKKAKEEFGEPIHPRAYMEQESIRVSSPEIEETINKGDLLTKAIVNNAAELIALLRDGKFSMTHEMTQMLQESMAKLQSEITSPAPPAQKGASSSHSVSFFSTASPASPPKVSSEKKETNAPF